MTKKKNFFIVSLHVIPFLLILISHQCFAEEVMDRSVLLNNVKPMFYSSLNLSLKVPAVQYYLPDTIQPNLNREPASFVISADEKSSVSKSKHCFKDCRFVRITAVPTLFFAAGAFSWSAREKYRETRNRYVPEFNNNYDDFLQWVPTASVYGLNLAGVKGKHTVGRATMNYLYGQIIMNLAVSTLKSYTHVLRPDGSAYNSFPSGHTATAFAGATFLHKEYGQYRDPMYSLFAYSMAAGTGMGRQLNNRHWVSDVLVGAGIGILSTELGYLIGDKIHKNWGVRGALTESGYSHNYNNPSFLEMKLGAAWSLGHELSHEKYLHVTHGFISALEGAYFFNRYFGIGGEVNISSFPFTEGSLLVDNPMVQQISKGTYTQALGAKGFFIGPYVDLPLSKKWSFAAKLNPGYAQGVKGTLSVDVKPEYQTKFGNRIVVEAYKPGGSFALIAGVSLRRFISRTVSVRGFLDYIVSNPSWNVATVDILNPETGDYQMGSFQHKGNLEGSCLSAGFALTAIIW